ncbi:RING finger protein 24 isoform X3 [Ovis aries]|uniref:RING finger protein 24 isoform X3 n=1 Tax=Ovis aries TaxID=9940 RepID=UPI0005FAC8A2|nr:RING finger protein 24 isoform X3 [Ovis aries]
MSSDFPHYNFRMPNIGFQNLPLNIYIVVFGTAIFVFILSLLFCCYLIRLRHQAHKEFYAYKQVILKEKVKELNLHEYSGRWITEDKNTQYTRSRREPLQLDQGVYEKPTTNFILIERLEAFPPKRKLDKDAYSNRFYSTLYWRSQARAVEQEKVVKGIQIGR